AGAVLDPACRRPRLRCDDRHPGEEESEPSGNGPRLLRASAGEVRREKRRRREEAEVVRPGERGGDGRNRDETARGGILANRQAEEKKHRESEERIRARLTGVEEEKRRRRGEPEKATARVARQPADHGEDERGGEEWERAEGLVHQPERLDGGGDGLLQEIEERRSGILAQGPDDLARRQPRDPRREDFVVPQRPLREEPRANRERHDGGGHRGGPSDSASIPTL